MLFQNLIPDQSSEQPIRLPPTRASRVFQCSSHIQHTHFLANNINERIAYRACVSAYERPRFSYETVRRCFQCQLFLYWLFILHVTTPECCINLLRYSGLSQGEAQCLGSETEGFGKRKSAGVPFAMLFSFVYNAKNVSHRLTVTTRPIAS